MSSSSHPIQLHVPRSKHTKGPFGRMFRGLTPWSPPDPANAAADMLAFARAAMAEPDGATNALDNTNMPAGYTYFGQFVDHDITFDPTSSLQRQNDPDKLHNFRTPALDLDCLYGEGPHDEPFMYNADRGGMFLIGQVQKTWQGADVAGSQEPDLPRNVQGRALIGDMRNDENVIVSQFQLAMLRLHNAVLGQLMGEDPHGNSSFALDDEKFHEAQRIVRWCYQYIVWNDFVRRLVPNAVAEAALTKENGKMKHVGTHYGWTYQPFMPVEFSVAAYRFGHSLIRPGYQVNLNTDVDVGLGFGTEHPIFFSDPANPDVASDPLVNHDLSGFRFFPHKHTVQWDWYFEFAHDQGPFPQPARRIDPMLSASVSSIPDGKGGAMPLAFLNLMRSWRMDMPTGTAVANEIGVAPHAIGDPHEDILFHYILKEAALLPAANSGKMLGQVGGTIVAEVFAGLLASDPHGWVRSAPVDWTPADEPAFTAIAGAAPANGGDWEVADLLKAAGAPITDGDVANTIATGKN